MEAADRLLAEAERLFDVAGVAAYGDHSMLVLGLLTSSRRDLDEFTKREDGRWDSTGFQQYISPKVDIIMELLADLGLPARRRGRDGYTHNVEVALKRRAVAAGIGRWGRNSLLLHPEFGLWLRFSGVEVMVEMPCTGPGVDDDEENPLCRDCNACVEACPEGVLDPYFMREPLGCRTHFGRAEMQAFGRQKMCELCLTVCPVRAKPE